MHSMETAFFSISSGERLVQQARRREKTAGPQPSRRYSALPCRNRSFPPLSMATVRGRSLTAMRLMDSHPKSSKAITSAASMHRAMSAPAPPTAAN